MRYDGDNQLPAAGFFNPMLGGGDSVGVSGGGAGGLGGVFDIEDGWIVRCALVFGRQWLRCDNTRLAALDDAKPQGVIYAEIDHSSAELKLSVKHNSDEVLPDNSLQRSYRALYYASNGEWVDVRFQPAMFAMN